MSLIPNAFEFDIATALKDGATTPEGIARTLAASNSFVRAIENGLADGKQKGYEDVETMAKVIRSHLAKAFSAASANQMF